MFQFVTLVGFAFLAITAFTAASPRSTHKSVVDARINSVIDQMKDFIGYSYKVLGEDSSADKEGVYARASALKADIVKLVSTANTTIQNAAAKFPGRYEANSCGVHIRNLTLLQKSVEDDVDSCTVPVVASAAFTLREAVKSVTDAIATLENLKSNTDSCADSKCPEVSNAIARVQNENIRSMNAARNGYRNALHNIDGFDRCVRTLTRYPQMNKAAQTATMKAQMCLHSDLVERRRPRVEYIFI